MKTLVTAWTGATIRALRLARRMSVRDFGEHIGVSARMVSKWESGDGSLRPRPINQSALDRSLSVAPAEVRARFDHLVGEPLHVDAVNLSTAARMLVRHTVDEKLMVLVEPGPFSPTDGDGIWLMGYLIDVHPVTGSEFQRFAQITGHDVPIDVSKGEHPVLVRWPDALSYTAWSAKALPTVSQWQRAMSGDEGVVGADALPEWAGSDRTGRATRVGTASSNGLCTFRTVSDLSDMLRLLGI